MRREVLTVREDQPIGDLIEMLVREHIHGAPVVDADGLLRGVVTQQNIFFSSATLGRGDQAQATSTPALTVADVMTSPAVFAAEDTDIEAMCRMMHRLRIHRLPIVLDGRLTGIVSSLDVCAAVADGRLHPAGEP